MAELDNYLNRMSAGGDVEAHRRSVQATQMLKEIFLNLVKHGKTARLYKGDHYLPRRFLEGFTSTLSRFLEEFEVMAVEICPDHIAFNEHTILAEDLGEHLAYGLYSEGVRAISVERGCEPREMKSLADLLAVDWLAQEEGADDLLTQAWRADFQHVHIDVVDRFSEEDDGGDALDREDLGMGRGMGIDPRKMKGDSVLVPEIQALLREMESNSVDETALVKLKQDEVQVLLKLREELKEAPPKEGGDASLIFLDPASAAALSREVEQVNREEDTPFERMAEVIFELARMENTPESAGELGVAVARSALALVEIGDVHGAARLLHRLLALLDLDLFPGLYPTDAFKASYASLLAPGQRERFVAALLRRPEPADAAAPLFTLLAPLPMSAIPSLMEAGRLLESPPELRQVFADALATLLQHDGESILKILEQHRGPEAAIPLLALARLDFRRGLEVCLAQLRSEHESVREAALRSLRRYQSPNITVSILKSLDDPSSKVRVEALRYLSVYRDPALLEELALRIRSEDFSLKDEEELKAWLMAYGIIGREQAVPLLQDLALDRVKQKGDKGALRAMAVRGLYATRAATAKVALKEVSREHPALRGLIQSLGGSR